MVIVKPLTGLVERHAAIHCQIVRAKPDATSEIVAAAVILAGTAQAAMPATELAVPRELVVPATELVVPRGPVVQNA
jgi:hypothetical protein